MMQGGCRMKESQKGLLMVVISSVVFGAMPAAVTVCYSYGATSALVMLSRYLILAVALLPIVLRQKGTWRLYVKNLPKTAALSVAGGCTPLLLFAAYQYLPTGITTTIHFLYPTVVVVICVVLFHEKLSRRKAICLALCCAGMLLMLDLSGGVQLSVPGLVLTLLSSLTWAAYIVLLDKLDMQGATKEQTLFHLEINGMVLMTLYGLAVNGLQVEMPPMGWLSLLISGFVLSVFGTLMFVFGVRKTGAQVSAIASTLEPIVSILVGVLFLHEPLSLATGIGSALILLAVFLLSLEENERK